MNLIHSKLVFFLNVNKINTEKKTCVNSASELHCLLFFKWTMQFSCTVHLNSVPMYMFMLIALFIKQCN